MKSFLVLTFSFIVTIAILAPSFVVLLEFNSDSTLVIDFNEEEQKEQKEEKKELNEKDIFFYTSFFSVTALTSTSNNILNTHNTSYKINALEIFLPPPRFFG